MDPIRFAISKPVTITVGVILVLMFGLIGLGAMPVQLSPTVDRPEISVTTIWPGRSPQEIVDEIAKEQEEQLKNVESLKKMKSVSREGECQISLEFYIGTDIDRALQEVSDSLRQVPEYPPDVEEPVISASGGAADDAIAWIIIDLDPARRSQHPHFDVSTLFHALDKEVKPYLERVEGVAEINIFGGREREMRVLVDPTRLAQRGLNHIDLLNALRAENRNVSAGTIAEGKRDYRVRVIGQFTSEDDILNTIIAYREGGPVYVRDVATVELGYVKRRGFVRSLGYPSVAINAKRRTGANVMQVMSDLRQRLDEVRTDILPYLHPEVGPHLRLRQVYDETTYIDSAVALVTQNLWIGGSIAAFVLLLFLRSFTSTGVIALAIPISVIGTFLALLAMGRSLNVISLAGLAFAVGMVVDNAIVVLENIYRHLHMGKPALRAAYDGSREVWGAIFASTLTTVAVFVPILTVQEEAGQLFRDISLAIVSSVVISLIVSITVIPAACSRWLRDFDPNENRVSHAFHTLFGLSTLATKFGNGFSRLIHWTITGWRAGTIRPAIIFSLTIASLIGAATLRPPLDYLPAGNRNLVFGGLLIPPGYSVEHMEEVARRIEGILKPYVEVDASDKNAVAALPPIPNPRGAPYEPVGIENFFIGAFGGGMFVGATSADEQVVIPIGALASYAMNTIPDAFGGANQSSLFGRGVGGGNTIDVEISGPNLDRVTRAADAMFGQLISDPQFGPQNVRPDPANFNLEQPEWRAEVNRRGRELGLRPAELGTAVRALFDGAFVGDYFADADTIDINLLPAGGRLDYKEQLADVPIATPAGPVVPLESVLDFVPATAPQEIHRIEELPSVTLRLTPPSDQPLETTMAQINRKYVTPLREQGLIDSSMRVRLEGTAAKLDEVKSALLGATAGDPTASPVRTGLLWTGIGVIALGAILAVYGLGRAVRFMRGRSVYGAVAAALLFGTLGAIFLGLWAEPQLIFARFIWALVVTYLLMCALFESFTLPFIIMFTVPFAIVGGFAGLAIVHARTMANPVIQPQNLDVLTMLGFVILVGVVVNNAILIVHQSLNLMRGEADTKYSHHEVMEPRAAIAEAVRTRIRPVFMSTLTSVAGMTPLVLFPGAGSELYRGLGSVVIGGLILATVFTLVLVPLLMSFVLDLSEEFKRMLARGKPSAVAVAAVKPSSVQLADGFKSNGAPQREREEAGAPGE